MNDFYSAHYSCAIIVMKSMPNQWKTRGILINRTLVLTLIYPQIKTQNQNGKNCYDLKFLAVSNVLFFKELHNFD